MNRFSVFAAAISGMIVSGAALPAGDVHPGDAQAGAGKAAVCQACHGANGNSVNGQWPSLAGLGADFDTLVNTGLEADPSYWQAGEKLYRGGDKDRGIPACMACHGPTGAGNEPAKFPALRGQHSEYVVKQLNDYVSGARPPGPGGIMPVIAKRLSPEDMRNVASYVQGLR